MTGTVNARAMANMRANMSRDVEWFIGLPPHKMKMVIVAGGPSLRDRFGAIKKRKRHREIIVGCNAAHRLLRKNGIEPDFVAFVDPTEEVCDFVDDDENDGAIYLVASSCHPSVFDKLKNRTIVMWHADAGVEEQKAILDAYPSKPSVLIGGGNTIALRMLTLGHCMGFRDFHMYGVDSSFANDGADHAYRKSYGPEPFSGPVEVGGKIYTVAPWMAKQAEDFVYWYSKLRGLGCAVHVHGEGLIPDIFKRMNGIAKGVAA